MPVNEAVNVSVTPPASDVMIQVENLSKNFGRVQALKNISFEVLRGEILGFLGPNGAGKTTTMRILTGYFPPTTGKVWIDEGDFHRDAKRIKHKIGYLPEHVPLYRDMQVEELLRFVADLRSVPRKNIKAEIEEKLKICGLTEVRSRIIGNLSKGFRQRVGLAQALIGDPKVLVLDEPTSGLDPRQIIEIRKLIRELARNRTVILSTHILSEVSMICDRVIILNGGKVVASGTTQELEDELSRHHEIFVSIGDHHRKMEAFELLKALPGVEYVKEGSEHEGQVDFTLSTFKDADLRPIISRLFVEHDIPLLEIRSGRLSLEEIYIKIVSQEPT
ncbi:MAG: ATP-binding cassette domain-containing protein [Candidatus Omnitrophica bacterium]|nr:ATP-binding cassette domain-containing protein [Candidatus Omnitrophota bacterium]